MATIKKRYTTNDGKNDWIVSAIYDDKAIGAAHWFEVAISAVDERTGDRFSFPPEIRTYRIGEIEHTFRQSITLDFDGDRDAALDHHMNTIFRRVYSFIERGH